MFRSVKFATYLALLVYLSSYWAVAKEISSSNSPILFSAETLTYNDKKKTIAYKALYAIGRLVF